MEADALGESDTVPRFIHYRLEKFFKLVKWRVSFTGLSVRGPTGLFVSLSIKDTLCILKTPLPIDWPLAQGMQKTQEGAYNEGKLTCQ